MPGSHRVTVTKLDYFGSTDRAPKIAKSSHGVNQDLDERFERFCILNSPLIVIILVLQKPHFLYGEFDVKNILGHGQKDYFESTLCWNNKWNKLNGWSLIHADIILWRQWHHSNAVIICLYICIKTRTMSGKINESVTNTNNDAEKTPMNFEDVLSSRAQFFFLHVEESSVLFKRSFCLSFSTWHFISLTWQLENCVMFT